MVAPNETPCHLTAVRANELLRQMARADEASFEEFMHLFRGFAFQVIGEVVWDRFLKEEVFHDALLKLYRSSPRFDANRGSALAYFSVLLRRTAIDRVRGKQFICFVENPYDFAEGDNAVSDSMTPAEGAELASEKERLEGALSCLSPALRRPMRELYETGGTHCEIAQSLRIPLGTAKASIRRGVATLKSMLDAELVD